MSQHRAFADISPEISDLDLHFEVTAVSDGWFEIELVTFNVTTSFSTDSVGLQRMIDTAQAVLDYDSS